MLSGKFYELRIRKPGKQLGRLKKLKESWLAMMLNGTTWCRNNILKIVLNYQVVILGGLLALELRILRVKPMLVWLLEWELLDLLPG